MKITILTDNVAEGKFKAEHGLSYLIEIDGQKILFDTGHSDIFLQNAFLLGIDIQNEVSKVVLSHGHWDHGNGLIHLKGKSLLTHPDSFTRRFRKTDQSYLGLNSNKQKLEEHYKIDTSKVPVQIAPGLWFLGEIPRINNFEALHTTYLLEMGEEDLILDDSALVAITNKGLIVISGCAHAGICNTCEYAKKVTGISSINAVIGGFHLKDEGRQTQKTLEYFRENKIIQVLPAHCTEPPAKNYFRRFYNFPEVKTGMVFDF